MLPLMLENVSYTVGTQTLLDDISLRLEGGVKTVVLGPNGAGKSLLLRLCHGLITPSAGRIFWANDDAAFTRKAQAMVFQRPVMLRRSAAANVDYALKLRGMPKAERRARTAHVLERTGLGLLGETAAQVLSGGEQQSLALARAWALDPEVLFLDEPTASLDPGATGAIERIILEIAAAGTKIILTTHDLGQARRVADEVIFLHRGRVTERSAADSFFAAPQSPEARAFLAGDLIW